MKWISCLRIDFGMGRTTVLLCSFEIPFRTWNKKLAREGYGWYHLQVFESHWCWAVVHLIGSFPKRSLSSSHAHHINQGHDHHCVWPEVTYISCITYISFALFLKDHRHHYHLHDYHTQGHDHHCFWSVALWVSWVGCPSHRRPSSQLIIIPDNKS